MSDKFKEKILKEVGFLSGESIGEDIVLFSAIVLAKREDKVIPTYIVMGEDGKTCTGEKMYADNGPEIEHNALLADRLYKIMSELAEQAKELVK